MDSKICFVVSGTVPSYMDMMERRDLLEKRIKNHFLNFDAGRTRNYEGSSSGFRINRPNHLATAPFHIVYFFIYVIVSLVFRSFIVSFS